MLEANNGPTLCLFVMVVILIVLNSAGVYDMVNKSYAVGLKTPIKDAPHDLVIEIYNYAYKLLIPSKLCRGITFLIQVMGK